MNIYTEKDYRKIIKNVISERKKLLSKDNFQELARHARIPKSYLSKVIHGVCDLNQDQLFLIAEYFKFDKEEIDFLFLLLDYSRSSLEKRKKTLLAEIKSIQEKKLETKEYIKDSEVISPTTQDLSSYFLDPLNQLVHMCLAISRYQENLKLIAQDLRVDPNRVLKSIEVLEKIRFIEKKDGKFKNLVTDIILPKSSPIYRSWLNQVKLMSIHRVDNSSDEIIYSLGGTFTGTEETKNQVKSKFLDFLKEVKKISDSAAKEEIFQINFDLFPWTY